MFVDYISGAVLLLSVGALAAVVLRKFPVLRAMNVDAIPEERHARIKRDLVAQRLQRKLRAMIVRFWSITQPMRHRLGETARAGIHKLEKLEREYRHRAHHVQTTNDDDITARVQALLEEAQNFLKQEEHAKAEQCYIEAISFAPHSVEVFLALGELYLHLKDLEHAEQTFAHALRLDPKNPAILLDLARVHEAAGNFPKALSVCQQAAAIAPNDPKTLDALLERSIHMGERDLAERTLQQLTAANPENQKLREFQERIEQLPPLRDTITRK